MKQISKILIVGLGNIGKRHLRILRGIHPNADIRVLLHQSDISIPEHSNGYFKDLEESIAFNPQVAVIATPATFHLNFAIALAKSGCNLLIEKPISHNEKGIQELIHERDQQGLVIQVGYNLRFNNALMYFRKQIHDGLIGNIYSVRCETGRYLPSWRPDTDYRKGVSANKALGGGVLLELSHEIDYLRWIFGEITSVSSKLKKHSELEIDVEDSAYLTLDFKSYNKNDSPVASLLMDFIRHDPTRTCLVIGEKGTLRWNEILSTVEHWKKDSNEWLELFRHQHYKDDTYLAEWNSFFEAVNEVKTPMITIEDGLSVMKVIEAVRTSNKTSGKKVNLNDI